MPKGTVKTIDGNEAVARVAYALNEVITLYPITPSSPMGEWADAWAAAGHRNLWGTIPSVIEMQSEGGAAGAIHGALQTGSLATTFTASQGLLLMIPNMYKIAGELTPTVFHIAARSLAAQALSIFGDHSDVMAARATGWGMLCSNSVQEAQDLALIAQAATLDSRIPFLHFFDGFRTSHEISKIETLPDEVLRAMIDEKRVLAHRERALSPEHPVLRGTAQNPDVYFQGREAVNPFYTACPDIVRRAMDRFATLTGRRYGLFEYHGAPNAERVIVLMGSGCESAHETVDYLVARDQRVGVLKVRLYRPFDARRFVQALPSTVKAIAILDRTKEPGSTGEPLYLDCVHALYEGLTSDWVKFQIMPKVVGGRYGLSSKEFTPAMIKAVFDNLARPSPKNWFTIGIKDDVSRTSLDYDPAFSVEPEDVFRALFYGLGSDGTVGANKDSIKIIGETTDNNVQAYFVYDSKKSGSVTVSHLRFGPRPIHSAYLISSANFVACHQFNFLERFDMLQAAEPGAVFLLNAPHPPEKVWDHLPVEMQQAIEQVHVAESVRGYCVDLVAATRESQSAAVGASPRGSLALLKLARCTAALAGRDYVAPDDFHLSSTALSFGTTLQASISESLMVKSSGLLGAGYVAAHSVDRRDARNYHYGIAPQALANLRLITGRRAALEVTAREYFVSGLGGFGTRQLDLVFLGDGSLAIRLYRRHALGFTYQIARRRTNYLELPDQTRARSRVGVFYTFLGSGGFGAVR